MDEEEFNEIHNLVEGGYLSEKGEPLKCTKCHGSDIRDHHGYEEGYVIHINRQCIPCGISLGEWDYGNWSW